MRIDKLTSPPEVGQRYSVPGVSVMCLGYLDFWPVLLPAHEDARFLDFPRWHYHIDIRFVTKTQFRVAERAVSRLPSRSGIEEDAGTVLQRVVVPLDSAGPLEWRRRICQRDLPYRMGACRRLTDFYAGRQCPRDERGWVCPHKGMSLAALEPDAAGNIVCPGHGLMICSETGVVLNLPRQERSRS